MDYAGLSHSTISRLFKRRKPMQTPTLITIEREAQRLIEQDRARLILRASSGPDASVRDVPAREAPTRDAPARVCKSESVDSSCDDEYEYLCLGHSRVAGKEVYHARDAFSQDPRHPGRLRPSCLRYLYDVRDARIERKAREQRSDPVTQEMLIAESAAIRALVAELSTRLCALDNKIRGAARTD